MPQINILFKFTHGKRHGSIDSKYTEPGGLSLIALFVDIISGQNDVQLDTQNT